jgi:hypothetical protein
MGSITGFTLLIVSFVVFFLGLSDRRPRMKKPAQRGRRRASEFLDLSGRLLQAMTVRRHGGSMMMMVVTEMAVALHLIQTIRQDGTLCQIVLAERAP